MKVGEEAAEITCVEKRELDTVCVCVCARAHERMYTCTVILALRRRRQEECDFQAVMGYKERLCLKNTTTKPNNPPQNTEQ